MIALCLQIRSQTMDDDVVVDREMLRAINADSRISILKALLQRQKTQSELAAELKVSAPTVLEHMNQLEKARLIEIVPEYADKKWKYYRLTKTGRGIVEGKRMNVILLLTSLSAVITGALIALYVLMPPIMGMLMGTSSVSATNVTRPVGNGSGTANLSYALNSLETSSRTFVGVIVMLFLLLTIALGAIYLVGRMREKRA